MPLAGVQLGPDSLDGGNLGDSPVHAAREGRPDAAPVFDAMMALRDTFQRADLRGNE
jgi:hypothetical protein